MESVKRFIAALLPRRMYRVMLLPYHYLWAWGSALYYKRPAKELTVIGVTGTKGKSSVSEMLFAILAAAGHIPAVAGTIRFAVGEESYPNLFKMTVPGRGFLQKFLRSAVDKGATHAIIELTSEAALQYRHLFLDLDALIFTNLQREHIESHGSFEKYAAAKMRIGRALALSTKRPRGIIANADDAQGAPFLALPVEQCIPFHYADAEHPVFSGNGVAFLYKGTRFDIPHPGRFSVMNALAAIRTAEFLGVDTDTCAKALRDLARIPGRAERIEAGQPFSVIVDYAHTPDSLRALYDAYADKRKICLLGNTGGGRDTWKRPLMGAIADEECAEVILTNEDPYDEDPQAIVDAIASGMTRTPRIIMDRREAMREAFALATEMSGTLRQAQGSRNENNVVVLISGKGTDPYIMEARGKKTPWSDAQVAREELAKLVARS